jgi:hypothetical protein
VNDKRGKHAASSSKPQLDARQRWQVEQARRVAGATAEEIAERDSADAITHAVAFGYAQGTVRDLLAIVDELTGGGQ